MRAIPCCMGVAVHGLTFCTCPATSQELQASALVLLSESIHEGWARHAEECPAPTDSRDGCVCGFNDWHDRAVSTTSRPILKERA